jgi:carbon-monoxide dehydrogenase medium subunit
MKYPPFEYCRARDLQEAYEAVNNGAIPYVGGTEILAAMGMGLVRFEKLVSLRSVPELRGIAEDGGDIVIAANTTHHEVAESPLIRRKLPMLASVAARIGNARVRAFGTVGGNLAFAEPRSDLLTALVAYGAVVRMSSPEGEREVSATDFYIGPYNSALRTGEILIHVRCRIRPSDVCAYRRFAFAERPLVNVGLANDSDAGSWRLAVGAAGEELFWSDFDSLSDIASGGIAQEIDVVGDASASEEYKRSVTETLIRRCIGDVRLGEVTRP